ncbi:MAG: hypothetical protein CVV21_03470 [Candidatus Goldiibacteriota bacterium HGW-Goldbacteria-1]|jgi:cytochrome c-type biogenesis protein CcmH/NrfG|nr:MAG: hypothetical protein CVV21_03470 [Candidatus Goldiibacteriota bacterium HGW-Goldbacteria-1]
MKKVFILFVMFLIPILVFAQDKTDAVDPEKYFSQAAVAYMDGKLDDATVFIMRALQLKPNNPKYSGLYDLIVKERANFKEISILNTVKKPKYMDDKQYNQLLNYINALEKNIKRQAEMSRNRAEKTIILLSERTGVIEKQQDEIVTGLIPAQQKQLDSLVNIQETGFNTAKYVSAVILSFILALLFVIIVHLRNLKKAEESIKFLKVRQDEQYQRLAKMEEEQKRLSEKP